MKKITLFWCIFLLCIIYSFSQNTLTAGPSILSGNGSGIQNWGDNVTLQAFKIDGSSAEIDYDTQFKDKGFGVRGARWDQIDYYQDYQGQRVDASEKIVINFNGPVNNVILTVGMLGLNEGRNGNDETGKWTGYSADGAIIANGVFGPADSDLGPDVKYNGTYGTYPFTLQSNQPLYSIAVEATGFGYGQGAPRDVSRYNNESGNKENNSDFNIGAITYTRVGSEPANTAPVANNDFPSPIREDIGLTEFSYDVFLENDADVDGDVLQIASFDFSGFPGTIQDKRTERVISFRTSVNFFGEIEIPYTITDGSLTDSGIITLTISDVPDDLSIGQDGPFNTNQNEALSIPINDLLINDSALPYLNSPVELSITSVGNAINGSVAIVGDNVVFTPANGFTGQASFTYDIKVLNDGFGPPRPVDKGTSEAIIINVETGSPSENRAPIANNDTPSPVREDIGATGFSYDVFLANDTDKDGDELEIVSFDFSDFPGTIQNIRSNREILFTTDVNFFGEIQIPYTISDGMANSSAVITLLISEVPDSLDFGVDGPFETEINELVSIPIEDLLANDVASNYLSSPVEVTFNSVDNAQNGTVAVQDGNIIFTPATNFVGQASFTYSVIVLHDGIGPPRPVNVGTSPAITVTVTGDVPQIPSINQKAVIVSKADESQTLQVNATDNRTSAIVEVCDDEGQTWTVSDRGNGFHKIQNDFANRVLEAWQRNPSNGDDVTIYSSNNLDWQQWEILDAGNGYYKIKGKYNQRFMTFTNGNAIMLDENDNDNQLWKFVDAAVTCDEEPTNNPPVAESDGDPISDPTYTVTVGETLVIPFSQLLANDSDPDGDSLTIIAVNNERGGNIVEIVGETVEFTGVSAFPGALFTYTVSDGRGGKDTGFVFLNVLEAPIDPIIEAVDDNPGPIREDIGLTAFSYDVFLANDNGENLRITSFDFSGFPGIIEDQRSERVIEFRTAVNFNGVITIPYTVTDGQNTDSALITLTITDIIDDLTIGDDGSFDTNVDEPFEIPISELLANDTANNLGGPITIELTAVGNASNGSVSIVGDKVVFMPTEGFAGQASFTYDVDVLSDSVFGPDKRVDEGTSNPIVINVNGDVPDEPIDEVVLESKKISLDGTIDPQQWGACTSIQAFAADDSPVPVHLSKGRIGVKGDRYNSQLDYNPFTNTSERIQINFSRAVTNISFTLGNLEVSEWQGADETGVWRLLDVDGNEVAQGIISPSTGISSGRGVYTFNANTNSAVVNLILEATPYGSGSGAERTDNNSDYSLIKVAFNPLVTDCGAVSTTKLRSAPNPPLVYPTLVTNTLNVEVDSTYGVRASNNQNILGVYFYNSSGILVKTDMLNGKKSGICNVNALKPGLYIVRVFTNSTSYSYKIIKN